MTHPVSPTRAPALASRSRFARSLRAALPALAALLARTALLAMTALVLPASAEATILLFDQARSGATIVPTGSGSDLPSDYGDAVTGLEMVVPGGAYTYGEAGEGFTPDVQVEISSSLASPSDPGVRLWQQGYGDLRNVVFPDGPGTGGAPILFVRLTAAAGFVVDLYAFELAYFGALGTTIAGVSVLSGSTELFARTNLIVPGNASSPGHATLAFETPLSAAELLIRIDMSNLSTGSQDNVGLDNVRFGQTPPGIVPEPGAAVSILLGLAGLAWRRSDVGRAPTRTHAPRATAFK